MEIDWNNLISSGVGVSNNWSDTVKTGRDKKEGTKKYGITMAVIGVVIISVAFVLVIVLKKRQ